MKWKSVQLFALGLLGIALWLSPRAEAFVPMKCSLKIFGSKISRQNTYLVKNPTSKFGVSPSAVEVLQLMNEGYQPIVPFPVVIVTMVVLAVTMQTATLRFLSKF